AFLEADFPSVNLAWRLDAAIAHGRDGDRAYGRQEFFEIVDIEQERIAARQSTIGPVRTIRAKRQFRPLWQRLACHLNLDLAAAPASQRKNTVHIRTRGQGESINVRLAALKADVMNANLVGAPPWGRETQVRIGAGFALRQLSALVVEDEQPRL